MIVNLKAKALYNKIFEGTETWVANKILVFQKRRELRKYVKHLPKLTSEQKEAVREFWKPYCRVKMDWFRYYAGITGKFDPRYIPEDLQHTKIDQYFNQKKLGYGFNDKNNYSLIFPGIKQPKTIVRKIGSLLFDEEYHLIDIGKAMALLAMCPEVIVKPTQETGGGRYIEFYDTKSDAERLKQLLLDPKEQNWIVQDLVKQHYEMAKMHPQSLNTVRVYTILLEDCVHILSASMRMGGNNSRIDNVSANSGIIAGVRENGALTECAYFDMLSGKTTNRHPQGMLLSEIKVPSFDKMLDTAKRLAQFTGHFRMVGWDFSVDEDGDIVLIEANMRKADTGPIQCLHGPFFGDLTERVLNEVFGRK